MYHRATTTWQRRRWLASLPGVVAFVCVYAWVSLRGEFAWGIVDSNYQSLGADALSEEPIESLAVLHIQPPGLNALYAFALSGSFDPDLFLQGVFFLVGLLTVVLVVAVLLQSNLPRGVAMAAGVLIAVIPTTTLYSLWPYSTALIALFVSSAILGIALCGTQPILGSIIFVISIVAIFFTRPSFVWIFALLAAFFPLLFVSRTVRGRVIWVSVAGACLIVGLQGYHLVAFGSWTTTSWTGQNLLKGLVWSGQVTGESIVEAAGNDPCLRSLALSLDFWGSTDRFDAQCFGSRDVPFPNTLALDESVKKADEYVQLNSMQHLEVATAWRALAWNVVKSNPLAIPQMVLGVGPGQTSIELALLPGHQFSPLEGNLVAGTPLLSLSRPLGVILPVGGLSLTILLGGLLVAAKGTRWPQFPTLLVSGLFAVQGFLTSIVPEFGENNRFLVEVYPALIIGSAIALTVSYQGLRTSARDPSAL